MTDNCNPEFSSDYHPWTNKRTHTHKRAAVCGSMVNPSRKMHTLRPFNTVPSHTWHTPKQCPHNTDLPSQTLGMYRVYQGYGDTIKYSDADSPSLWCTSERLSMCLWCQVCKSSWSAVGSFENLQSRLITKARFPQQCINSITNYIYINHNIYKPHIHKPQYYATPY